MTQKPVFPLKWEELPTGRVLQAMEAARTSFPRHGPGESLAVVVVDIQRHFMNDGQPESDAALAATAQLLDGARSHGIPVVLIRNVFDHPSEITPSWLARIGGPFLMRNDPASELHPGLNQTPRDLVIEKKHASAFSGTSLHDVLAARGIDTIILAGTATSGCVRATSISGAARHYKVLVVDACTYDARPLAGTVALYELAERYADVITLDDALAFMTVKNGD